MSVLLRFHNTKKSLGLRKSQLPFWQGKHYRYRPASTTYNSQASEMFKGVKHLDVIRPQNSKGIRIRPAMYTKPEIKVRYINPNQKQ